MDDLKKKWSEIIALYKLESELTDVFVEGTIDRVFFDQFFKAKKVYKKVNAIELVDFSEVDHSYCHGLDVKSHRSKLIILSQLLEDNIPRSKVRCVVDKDFDDFLQGLSNSKLYKTDFSCLESYLYCEDVVHKFFAIGIGNFPFSAGFVLSQLTNILKPLYCLRLLREQYFKSAQLVALDRNLSVDSKNGVINFDISSYLRKFILKNSLANEEDKITLSFKELFEKLKLDDRHYLNGHDFLEVFFLYVNKIKNTHNYKEENFRRTLFLAVDSSMIENYTLFRKLTG